MSLGRKLPLCKGVAGCQLALCGLIRGACCNWSSTWSVYAAGPDRQNKSNGDSIAIDDHELKCGICLEQFQDPRSLPCLHTFCLECLQRSLDENSSLKCTVCRTLNTSSKDRVILPVDQCVLPLRRLQQQEEIVGDKKCGFCGEAAAPVATVKQ